MKNVEKQIKAWCKENKLKLHKITEFGFIASKLSDVKAGMKVDLGTCNITDYKIRKIGTKRVYWDMLVDVYENYIDVSFGKQYKYQKHPAL